MVPPDRPSIYHITHVDNLAAIIAEGALISDAAILARGGPPAAIGMGSIKRRRLEQLRVKCHPSDYVGEYVPFFFCPRSIMLFVIHCANHHELAYRGGQRPIVHLEADLHAVVEWAESTRRRWAFSLSNAGAAYAEFRKDLSQLDDIDWDAVANNDFGSEAVKEGKQAEFLVYGTFPWELVRLIGVHSEGVRNQVDGILTAADHGPVVTIRRGWYF